MTGLLSETAINYQISRLGLARAHTGLRLARTNLLFVSLHPAATSINASARQHHGMLGACHYSPLQRD
ncbi:uncharacterized [Tachysurus ichikawai]